MEDKHKTIEEIRRHLVEQGLLKTLGSIALEGLRQRRLKYGLDKDLGVGLKKGEDPPKAGVG